MLKDAPIAFYLATSLACGLGYQASTWVYGGRLEALNATIELYDAKLNIASPDEAYKRMAVLNKNINTAFEDANRHLEDIIRRSVGTERGFITYSWMEPICWSKGDTVDTRRQVYVYNEMGKYLKIDKFFDKDYCSKSYARK